MNLFLLTNTPTTNIYPLSLHDALPISRNALRARAADAAASARRNVLVGGDATAHQYVPPDRKSTRLNSSHLVISYAVFCLKKKKLIIILLKYTHYLIKSKYMSTLETHL